MQSSYELKCQLLNHKDKAPHHSLCRSDLHHRHPGSFSFDPQQSSFQVAHAGHLLDHWHLEQDQYQIGL